MLLLCHSKQTGNMRSRAGVAAIRMLLTHMPARHTMHRRVAAVLSAAVPTSLYTLQASSSLPACSSSQPRHCRTGWCTLQATNAKQRDSCSKQHNCRRQQRGTYTCSLASTQTPTGCAALSYFDVQLESSMTIRPRWSFQTQCIHS
jgi:hypothetical protein